MHKLLSISLAALILFLSLKVTVAVHYCEDEIAQAALGLGMPDQLGCGMEERKGNCETPTLNKDSCCDDFIAEAFLDTEYSYTHKVLSFDVFYGIIPSFHEAIVSNLGSWQKATVHYKPPLEISSVIRPLIQVFII
ncbi:hypothetical protein RCC89_15920 [Cytophagaceae bacterium ABcell3]|nr:hypothetical protein RCC89_15920 [Cytophagaceae bacterium ABcell3]